MDQNIKTGKNMNICSHCLKKQLYIRIKDNIQICLYCKKEIKKPKKRPIHGIICDSKRFIE